MTDKRKYSDKHLEKVEPEFIIAVEKTVNCLNVDSCSKCCPGFLIKLKESSFYAFEDDICWCNINMQYKGSCPYWTYDKGQAISMFKNIIKQWKKWAGLISK